MLSMRSLALALASLPILAQTPVTCNVSSTPDVVRVNGESELVGDVLFTCTGGTPGASTIYNVTLFLNVNVTSKIVSPGPTLTEALMLVDDPQPGVLNSSNGCPYTGQVLGTPGVLACNPGSGNVYQGVLQSGNTLAWQGVAFVAPGPSATRTLRLTNVRANAANIGSPGSSILGLVSMSGPTFTIVNQPSGGFVTAVMQNAMTFTNAHGSGVTNLTFQEGFASAFKKRIENTTTGPLTPFLQDVPGHIYCSESGFTPEFGSTTPGAVGSADTGTRLVIDFSSLNPHVTFIQLPFAIVSSSGNLVAQYVVPPYNADLTGGTVSTGPGIVSLVVSGRAAQAVYEVVANSPYQGVNGCASIESFTFPATLSTGGYLNNHEVHGRLAPVDATGTASSTAARPRFIP